jgi:hypothetical protein
MQPRAEACTSIVIGKHRFAETRHAGPGVERAKGLARQQFGIVRSKLEADVEGLFHVGPPGGVERLVKQPGITPVAANRFDRKLPLVRDGQREEVVRLGEGFRDQLWGDTVVDDIEEAHVAARGADLWGEPCQRYAIAFVERSEIDDWQCHRGCFLRSIVLRGALKNGMSAN